MSTQTILTTFDFSEPATRSLRWAHELARAAGGQLEVVHVHPDLYDGRSAAELGIPWPTVGQEERYLRFLEQEVRHAVHAVVAEGSLQVGIHIVRGDPVKRVLAVAEQIGATLICVGATGKKAVARFMIGSVSEALLRSSPVPVLVVH